MLKAGLIILAAITSFNAEAAGCLATPVHGEKLITSAFGWRIHPISGNLKFHKGLDLRASTMTPLYAAATGIVTFRSYTGNGGNTIAILGDGGITTQYLHLQKYMVQAGQQVNVNELIGFTGGTSDYQGGKGVVPHLHFMVLDTGHLPRDPVPYLCEKIAYKGGGGPTIDPRTMPSDPSQTAVGPYTASASSLPSSAPKMAGWDGRSEQDVFFSEVSRRFLNMEWHAQIATCSPDAVLAGSGNANLIEGGRPSPVDCKTFMNKEMVEITGLQLLLDSKKMESRERIEGLLAASLAEKARKFNVQNQNKERLSTARAAGMGTK